MSDLVDATETIVKFFTSGDLSSLTSFVAEEYVDHQGLGGSELQGQVGFRRVVDAARSQPELEVRIEDLVAMDNKVALRLRWSSVNHDGRSLTRETLDLLRFVDGRMAEHWGAELYRRET